MGGKRQYILVNFVISRFFCQSTVAKSIPSWLVWGTDRGKWLIRSLLISSSWKYSIHRPSSSRCYLLVKKFMPSTGLLTTTYTISTYHKMHFIAYTSVLQLINDYWSASYSREMKKADVHTSIRNWSRILPPYGTREPSTGPLALSAQYAILLRPSSRSCTSFTQAARTSKQRARRGTKSRRRTRGSRRVQDTWRACVLERHCKRSIVSEKDFLRSRAAASSFFPVGESRQNIQIFFPVRE